jgi:uncharacterized protein YggU (UPF0235/DUF167 family)
MLLYLKIKPNQRFDGLERTDSGYVARIKEPAIDGKANAGLINFLSEVLSLPKSKIRVKKGLTARTKCLEIDCNEQIVLEKLEKFINGLHNTM